MFNNYTENAKRTIFFAKGEAAQLGSSEISTEHVLLALLRDEELTGRLMNGMSIVEIHDDILAHAPRGERLPAVDLPLSAESEEALNFAGDEAEALAQHISNSHILLGLLRVEGSHTSQLLRSRGLSVEKLRSSLGASTAKVDMASASSESPSQGALAQLLLTTTRQVNDLSRQGEKHRALKLLDDLMAEPVVEQALRIRYLTPLAVGTALSIGDTGLARRYCEVNLANNPNDPMALYAIADCLAREGDSEGAKSYAARCYELSASRKDAIGNGAIELLQKRFPEISLGS